MGKLFGRVLYEGAKNGLVVVADDEDFLDVANFGDCAEAVLDDGMACNLEERF